MNQATHDAWSADTRENGALRPALAMVATFGDTIFTRPLGGVGL